IRTNPNDGNSRVGRRPDRVTMSIRCRPSEPLRPELNPHQCAEPTKLNGHVLFAIRWDTAILIEIDPPLIINLSRVRQLPYLTWRKSWDAEIGGNIFVLNVFCRV